MSEEIKKQIHKRLENFVAGVVQSDVDSWIFNNETMLKIQELSKEFDEALVYEVMIEEEVYPFNRPGMRSNSVQARRILGNSIKHYGVEYEATKPITYKNIMQASIEIGKLFDELVVPAVEPSLRFVKNLDEWTKRVHELKEKYGIDAFLRMYETIERIRSLMWGEGYSEADAAVEVANRQEKEMEILLAERARRANQVKGSLAHYQSQIESTMEECLTTPYFEPTTEQQSLMKRSLMHGMAGALSLGSSMVTTYQGSGGHGYDISTNGGRHKKVVTGKAGNRYPVAKRRGVR